MGHKVTREGERKPEKGRKDQIKAVRADKIGAEVGLPVPEEVSVADHVVRMTVKRNLLNVEIPQKYKIAAVINHQWDKDSARQQQRPDEGFDTPRQKITSCPTSHRLTPYTILEHTVKIIPQFLDLESFREEFLEKSGKPFRILTHSGIGHSLYHEFLYDTMDCMNREKAASL